MKAKFRGFGKITHYHFLLRNTTASLCLTTCGDVWLLYQKLGNDTIY